MIQTPQNQKLLTNVAVVRLKKGAKRFELACYPNKVLSWRDGKEADLSEVLQVQTVFTNVSKGVAAKKDELAAAFGTRDTAAIIRTILEKGELQLGERERKHQLDSAFKDIAAIVADKCVNPATQRPIPATVIEKAMRDDLHYSVVPRRTPKQQALDVIRLLRERGFPIERAPMRLRVLCSADTAPETLAALNAALTPLCKTIASASTESAAAAAAAAETVLELTLDPSNFRQIEAAVKSASGGKAKLEVVAVSLHAQGDTTLE